MSNHEQDTNVGFGWRVSRTALELLLYPLTPQEITPGTRDHLEQFRAYLKEGYAGLIPYNHPSLRDGPDIVLFLLRQKELQKKHIISPIAIHQYKPWMETVARFSNVKLYPIITAHAKSLEQFENYPVDYGLKAYFDAAMDGLKTGALIPVALQGRRESGEGETITCALGTLLAKARHFKEKIVVLPIGLSVVGEEQDVQDIDALHLGKTFRYAIGEPVPVPELLQNYSFREVDGAVFKTIQSLVRNNQIVRDPMVQ